MCASCGCGSPNEKHGDSANITSNDIEKARLEETERANRTRELERQANILRQVIDNLRASI